MRCSLFERPDTSSRWSAVASASVGVPVTSAVSSIWPWAPLAADDGDVDRVRALRRRRRRRGRDLDRGVGAGVDGDRLGPGLGRRRGRHRPALRRRRVERERLLLGRVVGDREVVREVGRRVALQRREVGGQLDAAVDLLGDVEGDLHGRRAGGAVAAGDRDRVRAGRRPSAARRSPASALAGASGVGRDGVDHEPAAAHRRRPPVGEAVDRQVDGVGRGAGHVEVELDRRAGLGLDRRVRRRQRERPVGAGDVAADHHRRQHGARRGEHGQVPADRHRRVVDAPIVDDRPVRQDAGSAPDRAPHGERRTSPSSADRTVADVRPSVRTSNGASRAARAGSGGTPSGPASRRARWPPSDSARVRARRRPMPWLASARCSENGSASGRLGPVVADVDLELAADRAAPARRPGRGRGPGRCRAARRGCGCTATASTSPRWVPALDDDVPPGDGVARPPPLDVLAHQRGDVAPRRLPLVVAGEGEHALDRRLQAVERPQALVQHLGAGPGAACRARPRRPPASPRPACAAGGPRATRTSAPAAAARGSGRRPRSARRPARRARRSPTVPAGGRVGSRPSVGGPLPEVLDRTAQPAGQQGADDAGDERGRRPPAAASSSTLSRTRASLSEPRLADPHDQAGPVGAGPQRDGGDEVAADVALGERAARSPIRTISSACAGPSPATSVPSGP